MGESSEVKKWKSGLKAKFNLWNVRQLLSISGEIFYTEDCGTKEYRQETLEV